MLKNEKILKDITRSVGICTKKNPYQKILLMENKENFQAGFKRLANFLQLNQVNLHYYFEELGIPKNINKLDLIKDSFIYDIIETYELEKLLKDNNQDWGVVWESIKKQLTKSDDGYGSATNETIENFRKAFDELQITIKDKQYSPLYFQNFFRDEKGFLCFRMQ